MKRLSFLSGLLLCFIVYTPAGVASPNLVSPALGTGKLEPFRYQDALVTMSLGETGPDEQSFRPPESGHSQSCRFDEFKHLSQDVTFTPSPTELASLTPIVTDTPIEIPTLIATPAIPTSTPTNTRTTTPTATKATPTGTSSPIPTPTPVKNANQTNTGAGLATEWENLLKYAIVFFAGLGTGVFLVQKKWL
jgi:hypothetical protein